MDTHCFLISQPRLGHILEKLGIPEVGKRKIVGVRVFRLVSSGSPALPHYEIHEKCGLAANLYGNS
jgi:hypothetical protein